MDMAAFPDDVGHLECAAFEWLQRLHGSKKLPSKGALETLRRRERAAHEQTEILAHCEARCAALAEARSEEACHLNELHSELLRHTRQDLLREQRLRLEAEAKNTEQRLEVKRMEQVLAAEVARRETSELSLKRAGEQIASLNALVADDQALIALDEFRDKFELQRNNNLLLHQQLAEARSRAITLDAHLQRTRLEYDDACQKWSSMVEGLLNERNAAHIELTNLRTAGADMQAATEAVLANCSSMLQPTCAAALHSGLVLQEAAEDTVAALDPLIMHSALQHTA